MEKKIVDSISHSEIRNVLIKHSIKWRRSKTILGSNIEARILNMI
jgi:hypothetical protein